MLRTASALVVLSIAGASTTPARADRFEDIGPSLGLPQGAAGTDVLRELIASVSAADIDGDGDVDLVSSEPLLGLTIYLREGAGFRAAPEWIEGAPVVGSGQTLFDMDADGDLDLFFARASSSRLYENRGDKLVDVSASHLPDLIGTAFTATAVDIDGDRDLDLLVARYIGRTDFPVHACLHNLILVNDGRGHFRDISEQAGISGVRGCSFTTLAFDLDDDRDLDLITINDFAQFTGATELWLNVGRDDAGVPRFVEAAAERGLVAPVYGMGAAIEDLDQDGHLDLFITNIGEPLLFEVDDRGHFVDVGPSRGLSLRYAHDLNLVTWAARMIDLDRDGYLDLLAAASTLAAADFIASAPEMQSPWVRQEPNGSLLTPERSEGLDVPGSAMRDFAVADLDGDQRPELIAAHLHGGISVLRDRTAPPPATTIELVPSTTGPDAAGAVLVLDCDGASVTRHVVAGGSYGSVARARVELTFAPPCVATGRSLSGRVRWPSGFTQAIEVDGGKRSVITEPSWLSLEGDALVIDLSADVGAPADDVGATAHGLELGEREALGERVWRWTVTSSSRGGHIEIHRGDGFAGPLLRVPPAEPEVWLNPPHPVVDQELAVYVRGETVSEGWTVRIGSEPAVDLAMTEDGDLLAVMTPPSAGPSELAITMTDDEITLPVEVSAAASPRTSELLTRDLAIVRNERAAKEARMRLRLLDDNGRRSALPLEALDLLVDGELFADVSRNLEGSLMTLVVPHTELEDGARLEVLVGGAPYFGPRIVHQLESDAALGALVSPERSMCALSEPRLRADGVDRGSVLIRFAGADGDAIPTATLSPLFDTEGIEVVEDEVEVDFSGWFVPVRAGTEAMMGSLSVRLAGQAEAVRCSFPLVAPRPLRRVMSGSPLDPTAEAVLDEPTVLRFVPQGEDGRAVGSGVAFRFVVDGAEADPITAEGASAYVGLGRYEITVTPRLEGPFIARAIDDEGRVLAERSIFVVDPDAEPQPEEDSPEEVEAPPEAVEAVEPLAEEEVEPAEVEEDGPEPSEPEPEPEEVDEPSEPTSEPIDGPPEPEIREVAEPVPGDAEPPVAEPAEPAPPEGDDGCAGGGPGSIWGIAALLILDRRRRLGLNVRAW